MTMNFVFVQKIEKCLKSFGCADNICCKIATGIAMTMHLKLYGKNYYFWIKLMMRSLTGDVSNYKIDTKGSMVYGNYA